MSSDFEAVVDDLLGPAPPVEARYKAALTREELVEQLAWGVRGRASMIFNRHRS